MSRSWVRAYVFLTMVFYGSFFPSNVLAEKDEFTINRQVPISPLSNSGGGLVANCVEVCINELSIRARGTVEQSAYVNKTKWKLNVRISAKQIKIVDNEGYLDHEYVVVSGKPTYTGIYTVGNHTEVVTIRTDDGILFWTKILPHDVETYTFSCSSPRRQFPEN